MTAEICPIPSRSTPGAERQDRLRRLGHRLAEVAEEMDELRSEVAALVSAPVASERPPVAPRLLTVPEAAVALGVGQSTVHGLIRSGDLGSRKIGGSRRIPVDEVDKFVQSLPVPGAARRG